MDSGPLLPTRPSQLRSLLNLHSRLSSGRSVGALFLRGERPQVLLGPGERQYLFLGREWGRLCGPRRLQQLLDGVMLRQGRPPWPLDEGDVRGQVLERGDGLYCIFFIPSASVQF